MNLYYIVHESYIDYMKKKLLLIFIIFLVSIICAACASDEVLEEQLVLGEISFNQYIETGNLEISFSYYNEAGKRQISIDDGENWHDIESDHSIIMEYDESSKRFINDYGLELLAGEEYEFSFRYLAIEKNWKTSKTEKFTYKLKEPTKFVFDIYTYSDYFDYYYGTIFNERYFKTLHKKDDGTYYVIDVIYYIDDIEMLYSFNKALIGEFREIEGKYTIRVKEFVNNSFNYNENLEMKIEYHGDDFFEETEWITCSEENYLTYEIYPNKTTALRVRIKETDTNLPSNEALGILSDKGIEYIESYYYRELISKWADSSAWLADEDDQDIYIEFTLGDVRNELQNASINANIIRVISAGLTKEDGDVHGYLYEFPNHSEAKAFYNYKISQNRNVKIIDDRYVAEVRIYDNITREYPDIRCEDTSFFEIFDWQ